MCTLSPRQTVFCLFSIVSSTNHHFTCFYLPITSLNQLFILFRLDRVSMHHSHYTPLFQTMSCTITMLASTRDDADTKAFLYLISLDSDLQKGLSTMYSGGSLSAFMETAAAKTRISEYDFNKTRRQEEKAQALVLKKETDAEEEEASIKAGDALDGEKSLALASFLIRCKESILKGQNDKVGGGLLRMPPFDFDSHSVETRLEQCVRHQGLARKAGKTVNLVQLLNVVDDGSMFHLTKRAYKESKSLFSSSLCLPYVLICACSLPEFGNLRGWKQFVENTLLTNHAEVCRRMRFADLYTVNPSVVDCQQTWSAVCIHLTPFIEFFSDPTIIAEIEQVSVCVLSFFLLGLNLLLLQRFNPNAMRSLFLEASGDGPVLTIKPYSPMATYTKVAYSEEEESDAVCTNYPDGWEKGAPLFGDAGEKYDGMKEKKAEVLATVVANDSKKKKKEKKEVVAEPKAVKDIVAGFTEKKEVVAEPKAVKDIVAGFTEKK
jgi:hypothetical protein